MLKANAAANYFKKERMGETRRASQIGTPFVNLFQQRNT